MTWKFHFLENEFAKKKKNWSSHHGNESDQEPRSWGFDPWPRSVGQGCGVAVSRGVGWRRGSDLALLWLWCRPAATAPIRHLGWDPPYAMVAALKKAKKYEEKIENHLNAPQ